MLHSVCSRKLGSRDVETDIGFDWLEKSHDTLFDRGPVSVDLPV